MYKPVTFSELQSFVKRYWIAILVTTMAAAGIGFSLAKSGPIIYVTKIKLPYDENGVLVAGLDSTDRNFIRLFESQRLRNLFLDEYERSLALTNPGQDPYKFFFGTRDTFANYIERVLVSSLKQEFVLRNGIVSDQFYFNCKQEGYYSLFFTTREPGQYSAVLQAIVSSFNAVVPELNRMLETEKSTYDRGLVKVRQAEKFFNEQYAVDIEHYNSLKAKLYREFVAQGINVKDLELIVEDNYFGNGFDPIVKALIKNLGSELKSNENKISEENLQKILILSTELSLLGKRLSELYNDFVVTLNTELKKMQKGVLPSEILQGKISDVKGRWIYLVTDEIEARNVLFWSLMAGVWGLFASLGVILLRFLIKRSRFPSGKLGSNVRD